MPRLQIQTVLLPPLIKPHHIQDRAVVVFDVLRATTSIAAALAAGVEEIQLFSDIHSAAEAGRRADSSVLLCGEEKCIAPPGFHLGNSPAAFRADLHAGHIMFMATTNGTKALIAASVAKTLLAGALINASAVAAELARRAQPVTLLCAGTAGQVAMEDVLGAGAVIDRLQALTDVELTGDAAQMSLQLFRLHHNSLLSALEQTVGGKNVINAGLGDDLRFCAQLDSLTVVGTVMTNPLRVVKLATSKH